MGRRGPDLTAGPIGKTLILFALPLLGSNVLQSINGSANAVWVSHTLGESALAAISNANQIFFLMLGAMFGLTMAANILIGQAVGARDEAMAKKVVGACTLFFAVASSLVGLAGVLLTPAILDAMGTPGEARAEAVAYLSVIFIALPLVYFTAFLMMAQRGTGDSRTPFLFSIVLVLLDVAFNPLLILGVGPLPRLGIAGSATATLIAQAVTLLALLTYLYRRKSILVLRPGEFHLLRPDLTIIRTLVFKGLPMAFQMMVISLAAVTMMSLVNGFGAHTAAAYGAAVQIWTYVQMPAMALGAAVSTMCAQNVGAGRMDRVAEVARKGVIFAAIGTTVLVIILELAKPLVMHAFLPAGSEALPIASRINAIALWGFIPFGVAFIFNGVVRATGAVWPPLLAMIIALWVVRVPFATALQPSLGADAVWWSFPVGSIVMVTLAAGYYRWGGWRKARMLPTADKVEGEAADTGLALPIEEGETA
ncbi:MATE family efflux transporter [Phenylobacterium sp. VNQ135]|uniref:MATE family efflux transporter n=1 Tax=Phenylobacterium sp. VNQ135 TaxID=3400922 RepID=UPI003C10DA63